MGQEKLSNENCLTLIKKICLVNPLLQNDLIIQELLETIQASGLARTYRETRAPRFRSIISLNSAIYDLDTGKIHRDSWDAKHADIFQRVSGERAGRIHFVSGLIICFRAVPNIEIFMADAISTPFTKQLRHIEEDLDLIVMNRKREWIVSNPNIDGEHFTIPPDVEF